MLSQRIRYILPIVLSSVMLLAHLYVCATTPFSEAWGVWIVAAVQFAASRKSGRPSALAASVRNVRAMGFTAGGAFFGPFLGVWLSLYAVTHGKVGVVCMLMATIPIIVIPQMWLIHRERPRLLEVLGAVITVAGISLLFL